MDQFSQEIINLIVSFIERYPGEEPDVPSWHRTVFSNLPRYSTISRAWKLAIECITFQKIALKSTEIDYFDAVLRGERRRFLSDLTLHVELPSYDDKACARFERAVDRNANNEAFTDAIAKLFAVLKSWEDDGLREGNIHFTLWGIYSRSDDGKRTFDTLRQHRFEVTFQRDQDLFEHRYMHSLIQLLRVDRLPSIRRVSRAIFGSPSLGRNLAMQTVVDMISKFPKLEIWDCKLYDNEKLYPANRVTNRHSFAFAFSNCTFPSLKTVDITFFHEVPLNQYKKPPDLRCGQSYDPLSTALRLTLSQCPNLTSLTLTGVFDSSLFWPSSEQAPSIAALSCWPNLQFLTVIFDPITPSGHWYFTDTEGIDPEGIIPEGIDPEGIDPEGIDPRLGINSLQTENSDDSVSDSDDFSHPDDAADHFDFEKFVHLTGTDEVITFRTEPNRTYLNPLILAFANFVKNTTSRSLLKVALTTGPLPSDDGDPFQFEICYYAPHETAFYGDAAYEHQSLPRLNLEVGQWVPDQEVLTALKEAGRRKWGAKLLVRFLATEILEPSGIVRTFYVTEPNV